MLCECDPYSYTLQRLFFLIMCNSLANLRHARVAVELHASFVLNQRSKSAGLLLLNVDMNNSRRKVIMTSDVSSVSTPSLYLSSICWKKSLLHRRGWRMSSSGSLLQDVPFAGAFPDSLLFRQSGTRGVSVALLHAVAWLW
jgi:hypothetical protein